MLDKGRISSRQLFQLLLITEMGTSLFLVPTYTVKQAGPDAWISVLIVATIYGLAVAYVCLALARRFPDKVLTEYLPEVLGRIPGKLLALIYAGFFVHLTAVMFSEGVLFVHLAFLRETPLLPLHLLLGIVAAFGVYLGIEVIARENQMIFPFFILSIVLVVILVLPDFQYENLLPVMENGIMPVLKGGMATSAWRGEVFIILMLYPYLNQKKEAAKTAVGVVIVDGLLKSMATISALGIFGQYLIPHLIFPISEVAAYIQIARFLERMQILVVIGWVAGVILKLAIFIHAGSIASSSFLGLKDFRSVIIPVLAANIFISIMYYDTYLKIATFIFKIWPYHAWIFEFILPATILSVAILRKKGIMETQ